MEKIIINIKVSAIVLIDFLKEPFNLRVWTVHRDLYEINGTCSECIIINNEAHFTEIKTLLKSIDSENHTINFSWLQNNTIIKYFEFNITAVSECEVIISFVLPLINDNDKRKILIQLLNIEFDLLKQYLEKGKTTIEKNNAIFLQSYHTNLSF